MSEVIYRAPRPCTQAIRAAESIDLPPHVEAAYRANELRDAFVDPLGRVWYAATDALRADLPADPRSCEQIPAKFWRPDTARRHAAEQHRTAKDAMDVARAERERRTDPTLELA